MEELNRLTRLRASIRGQLTKIQTQLLQLQELTDYEIEQRMSILQNYEKKFDKIQSDIEAQTEDIENEIEQRHTTEESILQMKIKLHELRSSGPANQTHASTSQQGRHIEGTLIPRHQETIPRLNFAPFHEKESFKNFIRRLSVYFTLNNVVDPNTKVYMLLSTLPPDLHERIYDLCSPEDPLLKSFEELANILDVFIDPKPSIWASQHIFISRLQHIDESIPTYASELKRLSHNCEFKCTHCKKPTLDAFLSLQFIRGLKDGEIRTKILQESEKPFSDLVHIASMIETGKKRKLQHYCIHEQIRTRKHQ